jgi:hypothetical protein
MDKVELRTVATVPAGCVAATERKNQLVDIGSDTDQEARERAGSGHVISAHLQPQRLLPSVPKAQTGTTGGVCRADVVDLVNVRV